MEYYKLYNLKLWFFTISGNFAGAEDLFANLFDGHDHPFASFFGGGMSRRARRGQDLTHPLKVTLEDLYNGKTSKLQLQRRIICNACNG